MEKLGVIGGMGAEATSYYYDQVVRHTAAACDQEHIDMVVLSKSTMPDRTLAIKTGEHAKLLATMKECAQALESLGCAHIAIPCNTSHYFYDQIQSFTKVANRYLLIRSTTPGIWIRWHWKKHLYFIRK